MTDESPKTRPASQPDGPPVAITPPRPGGVGATGDDAPMPLPDPPLPFNRILLSVVLLCLPPLALTGAAAWLGWLPREVAALAATGLLLYYALLTRRQARAIYDLRNFADELIGGDRPLPASARLGSPALRDLGYAIARLYRAKRDRNDEMMRLVQARDGVLDAVPDPVFALDRQGRILGANRAAVESFGSVIGRDTTLLFRQPAIVAAVNLVLSEKEARTTATLSLAPPVEREFTVAVQRLQSVAPDGTCAVLTLHDVTALRRAEQTRVDFVANASHEIRTPLTTLLGFIETLQGPAKDDPAAHAMFLDIMQGEAQRMARLVEDLLSLSRIEQHEHEHPTTPLALAPLLERVVAGLRPQADQRRSQIKLTVESNTNVIGTADEVVQLAQNLIVNALKYGKEGGVVTVAVKRKPSAPAAMPPPAFGTIAIAICDDGEGIPRAHLPRLTERFYRVDPARSKSQGGTGLGLAIVKHIINRHRGSLRIESDVGKGTCVYAYLPAAERG
ncbi:ATP-binding protein [Elstera sp.]|uniref:ATP-binding protein n=1 Tax=Elstera sp. TaxID=1916664 RepID=UPI0037BFF926